MFPTASRTTLHSEPVDLIFPRTPRELPSQLQRPPALGFPWPVLWASALDVQERAEAAFRVAWVGVGFCSHWVGSGACTYEHRYVRERLDDLHVPVFGYMQPAREWNTMLFQMMTDSQKPCSNSATSHSSTNSDLGSLSPSPRCGSRLKVQGSQTDCGVTVSRVRNSSVYTPLSSPVTSHQPVVLSKLHTEKKIRAMISPNRDIPNHYADPVSAVGCRVWESRGERGSRYQSCARRRMQAAVHLHKPRPSGSSASPSVLLHPPPSAASSLIPGLPSSSRISILRHCPNKTFIPIGLALTAGTGEDVPQWDLTV
ncbi:hypothetical protein Q8A73_009563 [Channa argus]|nr:hypothetical protein Q8A73_009563 [Channa argus]